MTQRSIPAIEAPKYSPLEDGCSGDAEGLAAALVGAVCVYSAGDDAGYGHHNYDAIYRCADGRYLHAECGGCSCEGSGSWAYYETYEDAMRAVPEQVREVAP